MSYMFMVFNSEKIKSYLFAVGTVVFLLVIGGVVTKPNIEEVSASVNNEKNSSINIIQNEIIE